MASVSLDDVAKVYRDGTRAVSGLDLAISDGGFIVLVGPSGSGKATALRMVAGLEESDGVQLGLGIDLELACTQACCSTYRRSETRGFQAVSGALPHPT